MHNYLKGIQTSQYTPNYFQDSALKSKHICLHNECSHFYTQKMSNNLKFNNFNNLKFHFLWSHNQIASGCPCLVQNQDLIWDNALHLVVKPLKPHVVQNNLEFHFFHGRKQIWIYLSLSHGFFLAYFKSNPESF